MENLTIRSARDEDSESLIRLIAPIYAEYPGCFLDVDGEMPELRAPASAAEQDNGRWWVAEREGRIVGSVSVFPESEKTVELKKLYVAPAARGRGLGAALVKIAEREARERNASSVVLWTDTRFETAHRLYARLGFVRAPHVRALNDVSNTVEFHYRKDLEP